MFEPTHTFFVFRLVKLLYSTRSLRKNEIRNNFLAPASCFFICTYFLSRAKREHLVVLKYEVILNANLPKI